MLLLLSLLQNFADVRSYHCQIRKRHCLNFSSSDRLHIQVMWLYLSVWWKMWVMTRDTASSSRKTCVYHLIYEEFGSISPKRDYGATKEVVAEQVSALLSVSWVAGTIWPQAGRFSSHLFAGFCEISQWSGWWPISPQCLDGFTFWFLLTWCCSVFHYVIAAQIQVFQMVSLLSNWPLIKSMVCVVDQVIFVKNINLLT